MVSFSVPADDWIREGVALPIAENAMAVTTVSMCTIAFIGVSVFLSWFMWNVVLRTYGS